MALFLEGRVLLLDLGGVHEDDGEKVGRGGRRQDRPGEAVADDRGMRPAVVEVGVGEQDEIDVLRGDRESGPVPVEEGPLLVEAAVDEDAETVGLDEVRRSP